MCVFCLICPVLVLFVLCLLKLLQFYVEGALHKFYILRLLSLNVIKMSWFLVMKDGPKLGVHSDVGKWWASEGFQMRDRHWPEINNNKQDDAVIMWIQG